MLQTQCGGSISSAPGAATAASIQWLSVAHGTRAPMRPGVADLARAADPGPAETRERLREAVDRASARGSCRQPTAAGSNSNAATTCRSTSSWSADPPEWSPSMGGEHPGAVLLERDGALSALEAAFGAVVAGRGGIALVSGEAGIGKSSLVRAFVAAERRATRVLAGACDDLAVPRPLGPFLDIAGELPGLAVELGTGGVDAAARRARRAWPRRSRRSASSRTRTGPTRRRSTCSRSSPAAWRPSRRCSSSRSATTRSGPTTRCAGRWPRRRPIAPTGSSWSA